MRSCHYMMTLMVWVMLTASGVKAQFLAVHPASLELSIQDADIIHSFPDIVSINVKSESKNWTVYCFPVSDPGFKSNQGNEDTPVFMHNEYSDSHDEGVGPGFQMLNQGILLANGSDTGNEFIVANRLEFRFRVPEMFESGSIHKELRVQYSDEGGRNEEVILILNVRIEPVLTLQPQFSSVVFHDILDLGIYNLPGNFPLDMTSNKEEWPLCIELSPFFGEDRETLPPGILYMMIPSVTEKMGDDIHPNHISMSEPFHFQIQLNGKEKVTWYQAQLDLHFRIQTTYYNRAGEYTAMMKIYSPDDPDGMIQFPVEIRIRPANTMSLSASYVHFHADGPPAVWEGDKQVQVMVGSNCGSWSVVCQATDLTNPKYSIPNERLFVETNPSEFYGDEGAGVGFESLGRKILIASGTMTEKSLASELRFRLKTIETDHPGKYKGLVVLTHLAKP